ncbi:hypothetical protein EYF80_018133 [Liparis tanakae]|uniref:Uncharacterized protein n=1 Tax=Liparis tanakae TaxID=230148 RepID=A0A4Z2I127_9TELE|nr:hypothetical protein EYF80_018133 [Liparis tanakae]
MTDLKSGEARTEVLEAVLPALLMPQKVHVHQRHHLREEDDGLSVELVGRVRSLLDLGRDGEAQSGELPDLPEQHHQPVRVLDLQTAVRVVQVHHAALSSSSTSSHACRKPWKPESSGSRAAAMRTESSI